MFCENKKFITNKNVRENTFLLSLQCNIKTKLRRTRINVEAIMKVNYNSATPQKKSEKRKLYLTFENFITWAI